MKETRDMQHFENYETLNLIILDEYKTDPKRI
jgi:hypothetical protein